MTLDTGLALPLAKLVIIDDDIGEGKNQATFIQSAWKDADIDVKHPDEFSSIQDLGRFIERERINVLIMDHRLGENSGLVHTGVELALALRSMFPIKPLFILTKHATADELEEKGVSVDDVMDKKTMRTHTETYVGRLQRAAQRYFEFTSSLDQRLQQLIRLSLDKELTHEEVSELRDIRAKLFSNVLSEQIELADSAKLELEKQKSHLDILKSLLGK